MSERKTISINPELFVVNKKTRKNKANDQTKPLKMKIAHKNKTNKYKLLKQIREQQERQYNELFDKKKALPSKDMLDSIDPSTTKSDLQDSIDYLEHMSREIKEKEKTQPVRPFLNNTTIRYKPASPPSFHTPPSFHIPSIDNILSFPVQPSMYHDKTNDISLLDSDLEEVFPMPYQTVPTTKPPVYGCLKNGTLPTYRTFYNKTQKIYNNEPKENRVETMVERPLQEKIKEWKQVQEAMEKGQQKTPPKYTYKKKKTTKRRTFHVGKSKVFKKVGVLVSNKSIRKKVTTDTHKWKEKSIDEIRKYLIKNGFIKIGSTAPNDVLRKMYENAMLVGGDIKNHNTENMLYNYLNERPSNPF